MRKITIKLNGKDILFRFGLGFLGDLLDDSGLTIDEIVRKLNENPFKIIPLMMYHSAKSAMEAEGKEIDFNKYDIADWIDDAGGISSPEVVDFLNAFTSSLVKNVPKQDDSEEQKGEKKS